MLVFWNHNMSQKAYFWCEAEKIMLPNGVECASLRFGCSEMMTWPADIYLHTEIYRRLREHLHGILHLPTYGSIYTDSSGYFAALWRFCELAWMMIWASQVMKLIGNGIMLCHKPNESDARRRETYHPSGQSVCASLKSFALEQQYSLWGTLLTGHFKLRWLVSFTRRYWIMHRGNWPILKSIFVWLDTMWAMRYLGMNSTMLLSSSNTTPCLILSLWCSTRTA